MLAPAPLIAQTVPARDGLAVAADISVVVVAVAVLILTVVAIAVLIRAHRTIGELRDGVRQSFAPVSDRARSISDNVEFITQVVRADVEALNESVQALSDRLTVASEHLEDRVEDFNALMEVVQGEAEDLFLGTAATVRGVREGAKVIAGGRAGRAGDQEGADDRPRSQTTGQDDAAGPPTHQAESSSEDDPRAVEHESGDAGATTGSATS